MFKLTDFHRYSLYRGLIKRIVVPIVLVYMLSQGLDLAQIGYVIAVSGILGLVLEVPSGAIADIFGHKRTLIISSLLQGLSMLLYITLSGFWGMLIATALYWGAGTLFTGTNDAFLYELLEKRKQLHLHKKFWGQSFAIANAMGIVMLTFGSVLYVVDPNLPFLVGVLQFILAAYFIYSIKDGDDTHSVQKEEGFSGFWKGVQKNKHLLSFSHPFFWVGLYQALFLGLVYAIAEFHQLFLEEMGFIIVYLGAVFACKRLLTTISSHYAHVILKRVSPVWMFAIGAGWSLFLLGFYAFIQSPWVAAGILILPSILWGVMRTSMNDVRNQLIASGSRSSFLSIIEVGNGIIKTITVLIFGYAASRISIQMTYFFIPFIVTVPFAFILLMMHKTLSTTDIY